MSDISFLERFDRSGIHAQGPRRRRPGAVVMFLLTLLAIAVVAGVAFAVWSLLLKDDSKSPDELLQMGLTAHFEGRLVEAAELYHEVLLLDPTNKFAHYNIGVILQAQGQPEEAELKYRQALETDPHFVEALFNLAILRFEAGDNREAVELYRLVIGIRPDYAAAHLNLGHALK